MKKYLCLSVALLVASFSAVAQHKTAPANTPAGTKTPAVKWVPMDDVLALAAKNPKKIFVDVYADWCGPCRMMDKMTFSDPQIADYLNKNFYPVKFNSERRDSLVFNGKTYKFNTAYASSRGPGINEFTLALSVNSYPSVVYMDAKGQPITIVPGFVQPNEMLPILVFFAEDYYTHTSWEDFSAKVWPARQKELANE